MKFTIQYIPLDQIEPHASLAAAKPFGKLHRFMRDCLAHLLIVRRNAKGGKYTLLNGQERYAFLLKHTRKKFAPCLIDKDGAPYGKSAPFHRITALKLLDLIPGWRLEQTAIAQSFSIICSFIKAEPRFHDLKLRQKIRVLMLAVRFKRTTAASMKAMVQYLQENPDSR